MGPARTLPVGTRIRLRKDPQRVGTVTAHFGGALDSHAIDFGDGQRLVYPRKELDEIRTSAWERLRLLLPPTKGDRCLRRAQSRWEPKRPSILNLLRGLRKALSRKPEVPIRHCGVQRSPHHFARE